MKVRTRNFERHEWPVGRSYLTPMRPDGAYSANGVFIHPKGFARVFTFKGEKTQESHVIFIHEGRRYSRRWRQAWGDRTLARLAREMIEEVTG